MEDSETIASKELVFGDDLSSLGPALKTNTFEKSKKAVHFSCPLEIPGNELVLTTYTPTWYVASQKVKEKVHHSCDALRSRVRKRIVALCRNRKPFYYCAFLEEDSCCESLECDFHPGVFGTATTARDYRERFWEKLRGSFSLENFQRSFNDSVALLLLDEQEQFLPYDDYVPIELISFQDGENHPAQECSAEVVSLNSFEDESMKDDVDTESLHTLISNEQDLEKYERWLVSGDEPEDFIVCYGQCECQDHSEQFYSTFPGNLLRTYSFDKIRRLLSMHRAVLTPS